MKIISLQRISTIRHGRAEEALSVVLEDANGTKPMTVNADHPNWDLFNRSIDEYTKGIISNGRLAEIFSGNVNLSAKAAGKFVQVGGILDGRMTISNDTILVDHAPIDSALQGHILRLLRADGTPKDARNWKAFAKFVENLYANTSEFVREQLFAWLNYENFQGKGFTLTDDGCFLGYKGCAGTPDAPHSINTGYAIVNGVPHNGAIPNALGSVVEMPRNQVEDNPHVGCAPGLHVGTYAYATGWARGVLLVVKVNPRDVVSVPTECGAQKIRTCRYEVLEVVEHAYEGTTYTAQDDDDDWEENEDFSKGDQVSFTYRRKDGVTKNYTITVTHADSYYLTGENEDGDHRSFIRSRVKDLQVKNGAQQPAPASSASAPAADVNEGDVVTFTYTRRDGKTHSYEITVSYVDSATIEGERTDGAGYRSFLRRKVTDLKVAEAAKDATPTADATPQDAQADQNDSATSAGFADIFSNPLVNDLANMLGGMLSNLVGDVLDDLTSDEEEPGSEEDEEIRRNGYSDSDPWA